MPSKLDRGVAAFNSGRVDEALALFDQFLTLKPRHAGARLLRAHALKAAGRKKEALAELRSLPRSAETSLAIVELLHGEDALRECWQVLELDWKKWRSSALMAALSEGFRRSPEETLLKLHRLIKKKAEADEALAVIAEKAAKPLAQACAAADARRLIAAARKASPEGGAAVRKLLLEAFLAPEAELRAGENWAAAEKLLRALAPLGEAETSLRLASLLLQTGRREEAEKSLAGVKGASEAERFRLLMFSRKFEQAFALAEKLEPGCGELAWPWEPLWPERHLAPRALKEALEDLARLSRDPKSAWAPYYLGLLRHRLGREGDAKALEEAARLAGKRQAWMRLALGRLKLTKGDSAGALAHLKAWGSWLSLAYQAEALLKLGRKREAFAAIAKSEKTAPADRRNGAAAWRGLLYLQLKEPENALKALSRPECAGARYAPGWKGAALAMLGRKKEALKELDLALKLKPWDAEALKWKKWCARQESNLNPQLRRLL